MARVLRPRAVLSPRGRAEPPDRSPISQKGSEVSKQRLGNQLAAVVFLVIAIVDFTRDSSGIGVVFLIFAGVFFGIAYRPGRSSGTS